MDFLTMIITYVKLLTIYVMDILLQDYRDLSQNYREIIDHLY